MFAVQFALRRQILPRAGLNLLLGRFVTYDFYKGMVINNFDVFRALWLNGTTTDAKCRSKESCTLMESFVTRIFYQMAYITLIRDGPLQLSVLLRRRHILGAILCLQTS